MRAGRIVATRSVAMTEQATNRGSETDGAGSVSAGTATAALESPARGVRIRDVLALLRPHQWVKNVLLFLPLMLAHKLGDWHRWRDLLIAFVAFCLAASSVYVVN